MGVALLLLLVASQATAGDFEAHRPNYVLWPYFTGLNTDDWASEDTQLKFQLSVCLSVIDPIHLYAGYTQTSRVLLQEGSDPLIHDFNPEVYFDWELLQFGWEHESNGVAGEDSRAWNRAFAQVRLVGPFAGLQFTLEPQLWYAFDVSPETEKILEDRAFSDRVGGTVRLTGKSEKAFLYVEGGQSRFLGMIGINLISSWKSWYTTVQYFDGRGDSVLEFDRYTKSAGVGITFAP
jgi:phospholipase A1